MNAEAENPETDGVTTIERKRDKLSGRLMFVWFVVYAFCGIQIDAHWRIVDFGLSRVTYYAIMTGAGLVLGGIGGFSSVRGEKSKNRTSYVLSTTLGAVWAAACGFAALWVVEAIYAEYVRKGFVNDLGILFAGILAIAVLHLLFACVVLVVALVLVGVGFAYQKLRGPQQSSGSHSSSK